MKEAENVLQIRFMPRLYEIYNRTKNNEVEEGKNLGLSDSRKTQLDIV